MSGYVDCGCRDCFDVAVAGASDTPGETLCGLCQDAGCTPNDGECVRDDAYEAEEADND